ncbi:HD domain-containing protein [uncultured Pseudodesulfovibrio sp.]|uniref:HD domain-containing protein n=1 Tax=uncultured Pseudodesulfovibrio sp. TaxID=2035858 RepID=UPI0029C6BF10|nr:HD domain-containing protein [uncultured Pseudodesulfovibrio sp.]
MSAKDNTVIAGPRRSNLPPPPPALPDPALFVPDDAQCARYCEEFAMLKNVVEHSYMVADVATFLAERAVDKGMDVDVPTVRASALLHDLAKTYCIRHGGYHNQLGGAWVAELTGNPIIASGVTHHVYWPFALDLEPYFTPLAVLYADKRVNHNRLVSVEDRFKDLIVRYGIPLKLQDSINETKRQALELEQLLCDTLEVDLNACDFNSGRLV